MKKMLSILLAMALVFSLFACGSDGAPEWDGYPIPAELQAMYDAFIDAIDPDYAYSVAVELAENPALRDSPIGTRTAGSAGEHAAADWLAEEMAAIGLTDIEKVGVPCDLWQFNDAKLQLAKDPEERVIQLHSYASAGTPRNDAGEAVYIGAEIVYVGEGSKYDYEGLDVTGKIVLVDVNQRDNWWITYPMLEAEVQGAIAIIAAQGGGFSEISDDALNAQDICGPANIPCVSISRNDAEYVKAMLEEGPVAANLMVDNVVAIGEGTSYNVVGKIEGKRSDKQILIGAHYDMYFDGFQDNSAAVGLSLAIAKAMIDSAYVPENDILIVLHGAEEWGSSYTQFDWLTGSWEMINNARPEWQDKTLAFINFELPAYEFDTYAYSESAAEMFGMLDFFTNTWPLSPEPEGCYPDGMLTDGFLSYTFSDHFAYMIAGVPSLANGFLLQADGEDVFPFYKETYHSQFDTKDTYNKAVMDFNLKYYGALALYVDQAPALYLDFTAQADRLAEAVDEDIMALFGADMNSYFAAIAELNEVAEALRHEVVALNDAYFQAWVNGADRDALDELRAAGAVLTDKNLEIFKFSQDAFLGLMYESPIVPHEAPQLNIELMREVIACLEDGDIDGAFDAALAVNNYMEWYAMSFSPEVIAIETDMHWGESNQDNLYWGTGRSFVKAEVTEASLGLFAKYEEENADFSREIEVYEEAIEAQGAVLLALVEQTIADLRTMTRMFAE